jgi:hypothetical protein
VKEHSKHEGKRRAFEAQHVRTGKIRAFGTLAYAQIYQQQDERAAQAAEARIIRDLKGHRERNWVVERHVRGDLWVTADRTMQSDTFEKAINLVSGLSQYRVRRLYGRRGH